MSSTPIIRRGLFVTVLAAAMLATGGCPLDVFLPPAVNDDTLFVDIVNDTDETVVPNLVFDESTSFLAQLFPGQTLDIAPLAPGEVVEVDFACDRVGVIQLAEPFQIFPDFDAVAPSTSAFIRGEDYECGDLIEFIFQGNDLDFGVIVVVNGQVIE